VSQAADEIWKFESYTIIHDFHHLPALPPPLNLFYIIFTMMLKFLTRFLLNLLYKTRRPPAIFRKLFNFFNSRFTNGFSSVSIFSKILLIYEIRIFKWPSLSLLFQEIHFEHYRQSKMLLHWETTILAECMARKENAEKVQLDAIIDESLAKYNNLKL
jgi:hypothetical protein